MRLEYITALLPVGSLVEIYYDDYGFIMGEVLEVAGNVLYVKLKNTSEAREVAGWYNMMRNGLIRIYSN